MKYDYVFWDWNGTLIDDAFASMESVNLMLARRNRPPISIGEYREYVDIPIIKFYEKTFDMSREDMDSIAAEFNEGYSKCLLEEPLREGARETLRGIKDIGVNQCIFSSSANDIINRQLEAHGISRFFETVLGSGDYYVGSKLERTRSYIINRGIDPKRVVFVGDMEHDREVALACGGDCVLITGGHRPEEALKSSGAKIINSLSELPVFLKSN